MWHGVPAPLVAVPLIMASVKCGTTVAWTKERCCFHGLQKRVQGNGCAMFDSCVVRGLDACRVLHSFVVGWVGLGSLYLHQRRHRAAAAAFDATANCSSALEYSAVTYLLHTGTLGASADGVGCACRYWLGLATVIPYCGLASRHLSLLCKPSSMPWL